MFYNLGPISRFQRLLIFSGAALLFTGWLIYWSFQPAFLPICSACSESLLAYNKGKVLSALAKRELWRPFWFHFQSYNLGAAPLYALLDPVIHSHRAYRLAQLGLSATLLATFFLACLHSFAKRHLKVASWSYAFFLSIFSANLLISLFKLKWHVWAFLAVSAVILLYREVSQPELRKKNIFFLLGFLLISCVIYVYNVLFLLLFLIFLLSEKRGRITYLIIALALAGGGLIVWHFRQILWDRVQMTFSMRWHGSHYYLQHMNYALQQTKHAFTVYFSWVDVLLFFFGLYFCQRFRQSNQSMYQLHLFFLNAFLIAFSVQFFSEGLDNTDWHLWFWPSLLFYKSLGIYKIIEIVRQYCSRAVAGILAACLLLAVIKWESTRALPISQMMRGHCPCNVAG